MIDAHPALKAVSPQAPIANWWYDDFHHHGAFSCPMHLTSLLSLANRVPSQPRTGRHRFIMGLRTAISSSWSLAL